MAEDFLDGLFPEPGATNAAPPAPAPVEPQQTQQAAMPAPSQAPEGQPRAPDGKFASKEPAQAPASAQQQQEDPDTKPINRAEFKGYLDEREKRQKAEDRIKALEAQLQQFQQAPQPIDLSSIQNDPALIEQTVQGARTDAVFSFSEKIAREKHGDETVNAAKEWGLQRAQQNPAFAAEYLRQEHPIDWAVKQFKRDKILNEIGDDPDAFIEARIAARLGQAGTATPNQAQQPAASPQPTASTPAPAAPPRSLASAPAAGGAQSVPTHQTAAIDAVFR